MQSTQPTTENIRALFKASPSLFVAMEDGCESGNCPIFMINQQPFVFVGQLSLLQTAPRPKPNGHEANKIRSYFSMACSAVTNLVRETFTWTGTNVSTTCAKLDQKLDSIVKDATKPPLQKVLELQALHQETEKLLDAARKVAKSNSDEKLLPGQVEDLSKTVFGQLEAIAARFVADQYILYTELYEQVSKSAFADEGEGLIGFKQQVKELQSELAQVTVNVNQVGFVTQLKELEVAVDERLAFWDLAQRFNKCAICSDSFNQKIETMGALRKAVLKLPLTTIEGTAYQHVQHLRDQITDRLAATVGLYYASQVDHYWELHHFYEKLSRHQCRPDEVKSLLTLVLNLNADLQKVSAPDLTALIKNEVPFESLMKWVKALEKSVRLLSKDSQNRLKLEQQEAQAALVVLGLREEQLQKLFSELRHLTVVYQDVVKHAGEGIQDAQIDGLLNQVLEFRERLNRYQIEDEKLLEQTEALLNTIRRAMQSVT